MLAEENPLADPNADLGPFFPPPLGSEGDPFYEFRDELAHSMRLALTHVEKLKLSFTSSQPTSTAMANERLGAISTFRTSAVGVLKDNISHLEQVILHVERNWREFSTLMTDEDLAYRQRFLQTIRMHYANLETDIESLFQQEKLAAAAAAEEELAHRQRVLAAQQHQREARRKQYNEQEDSLDVNFNRFHHEQQIQTQNQSLEEISSTLGRLKQVGDEVYHEIEAQNTLLNDMQDDTSEAESKMATAMNRLDKILNTSSRGHTCAIVFLVCFLLTEILLVMVQ